MTSSAEPAHPAVLAGKVIVVTGAGSGIGRAIALGCAAAGAAVTIADVAAARAAQTQALAAEAGAHERVLVSVADVSRPPDVAAMMRATLERFGRLDGLVANAGVFGGRVPALELDAEAWEAALRINLTGAFLTLQAAARTLVAQGAGGALVAIGSSQGVRAIGANLGYSVAKAGVHMLVKALAVELAPHRVRVNAIVPGVTVTPATSATPGYLAQAATRLPLGEPALPEEMARLAVLLLSDALPHMTGSLVPVDSGVTAA